MAMNELTQAFSLPFPSPQDTIFWEFGYLASDSSMIDTIYSCGLSLVWDSIPDPLDRWNFGPKFPLTILPVTTVESEPNVLPENFFLSQNYPNPFNPSTKIKFTISSVVIASETKQSQLVTLKVFDILGNEVAILVNEEKPNGTYEVEFEGNGLTSGVYIYQLRAGSVSGGFVETKKMVLLR
jgi:hypothetical protein